MKIKKIFKVILYGFGIILFVIGGYVGYLYFFTYKGTEVNKEKYPYTVEFIDPQIALLNKGFKVCDENFIIQYYNPQRATYIEGKNGLRDFIISNYKNRNYNDSGYLNIRFIINCDGEAGRYIIHENDLNLKPIKFNEDLVNQLFDLTIRLKNWTPNYTNKAYRDSYMYLSYRIENGEITEILP